MDAVNYAYLLNKFVNQIKTINMAQAVPAGQKWWSGGKSPFNVEYGKLMMWYFLMSDAFTFGAFLISYGTIRFSSNSWPIPMKYFAAFPVIGEMPIPLAFVSLMTFILIMSSVTMVLAVGAGQIQRSKGSDEMDVPDHSGWSGFSGLPGLGMDTSACMKVHGGEEIHF